MENPRGRSSSLFHPRLLTFHVKINRALRRSQSIGGLAGIGARIFSIYREHVQRSESKVTSRSVPVTGG